MILLRQQSVEELRQCAHRVHSVQVSLLHDKVSQACYLHLHVAGLELPRHACYDCQCFINAFIQILASTDRLMW